MNTKRTLIIVILIAALGIVWYLTKDQARQAIGEIDSFEECVAAGNPVMESHPRQCQTPDGKHFMEDIQAPAPPAPLDLPSVPRI